MQPPTPTRSGADNGDAQQASSPKRGAGSGEGGEPSDRGRDGDDSDGSLQPRTASQAVDFGSSSSSDSSSSNSSSSSSDSEDEDVKLADAHASQMAADAAAAALMESSSEDESAVPDKQVRLAKLPYEKQPGVKQVWPVRERACCAWPTYAVVLLRRRACSGCPTPSPSAQTSLQWTHSMSTRRKSSSQSGARP